MRPYQVNIVRSIIFLVFTFACSSPFAAMYKWVDDEGTTHYTQQPPPAGIESITLKTPPAIDGSETAKNFENQQKFLDTEREKRQKLIKAQLRAAEDKARMEKNCELVRARLKKYITSPRVQLVQADGSQIRSTEEQRQEGIADSKEMIKKYCK